MRVALFTGNYSYTRDGASQTLNRLVKHLEEHALAEVRIYSPTATGSDLRTPEDLVPVPSVPIPFRREYRLALGLTPAVRRDVAAFAPDIVHLSTPDLLGFQAQKLARQLGVPVVSSLHTRFETYLSYYGLAWLEPLVEQALKTFYQGCDRVLVPTQALADEMAEGPLQGRVGVWSRGVDRDLFSPERRDLEWRRARGFADDEVVVLFFGRVVLEKALPVFAETIERLRARHPKLRTLVVGDGPARPWLAERLPDAVFAGFLAGPELARAVACADILLNPSITETFGNVTLEAMACGLPAICADLPNSRALVRDGETGLLCRPTDPACYGEAVEKLLDDPGLRTRLGQAARAATSAFSWRETLDSVFEAYQETISGQVRLPRAA